MTGQIPAWGYVVGAVLVNAALLVGMWIGYGRGWAHREEELGWEREQAEARRVRPVYRIRPEAPPEVAHEAWTAHVEQAMNLADPQWSAEAAQAITTGEIQAITDEMDAWLAAHVYAAPADYGQWLQREGW